MCNAHPCSVMSNCVCSKMQKLRYPRLFYRFSTISLANQLVLFNLSFTHGGKQIFPSGIILLPTAATIAGMTRAGIPWSLRQWSLHLRTHPPFPFSVWRRHHSSFDLYDTLPLTILPSKERVWWQLVWLVTKVVTKLLDYSSRRGGKTLQGAEGEGVTNCTSRVKVSHMYQCAYLIIGVRANGEEMGNDNYGASTKQEPKCKWGTGDYRRAQTSESKCWEQGTLMPLKTPTHSG